MKLKSWKWNKLLKNSRRSHKNLKVRRKSKSRVLLKLILKMKWRKRNIPKRIKRDTIKNKLLKIHRMYQKRRKKKRRESKHLLSRANLRKRVQQKMLKDRLNMIKLVKVRKNQKSVL